MLSFILMQTNTTYQNTYVTQQVAASSSFQSSSPFTEGSVVALTSDGQLQTGAGTSIYRSAATISATCPAYLDLDPLFSNYYLLSYADSSTSKASLQVMEVASDAPNKGIAVSTYASDYDLFEKVTMNQDSGLFVTISQDFSDTAETAVIQMGKVDASNSYTITMGTAVPYATQYSVSPAITRLTDSIFAVSYYEYLTDTTNLNTFIGEIIISWIQISFFEIHDNHHCLGFRYK